jgi:4-hydroxythreonine-4-phosphate dehydrogenase
MSEKFKIGISIGDINGIGLEIIIKTLADSHIYDYCTPIVYGHTKLASFYRRTTSVDDLNFFVINHPSEATGKKDQKKPNMINCWEEDIKIEPGVVNAAVGKYSFMS